MTQTRLGEPRTQRALVSLLAALALQIPWAPVLSLEWVIERVDSLGNVGEYTSLQLDAGGLPHVSYRAGGPLRYAHHDGSCWSFQAPDTSVVGVENTSLALDELGLPHISYYDGANGYLRYARLDSAGWHGEIVDDEWFTGMYSSIALDGDGSPHISYQRNGSGHLRYARRDGAGWQIENVEYEGQATSLALDAAEHPHISYWNNPEFALKYARNLGLGWVTEVVEGANWIHSPSIALDASSLPHIGYGRDASPDYDLGYARRDSLGWHIETVDSVGIVGMDASLELDAAGSPHISYRDYTNGDLKYAYKDPLAGWQIEVVDREGDVGVYTSLALDAIGCPHISYYDATNNDLMYARALPPPSTALGGQLVGGALVLYWTPVPDATGYWVYGTDAVVYFAPGVTSPYQHRLQVLPPETTSWSSAGGVGDPGRNWTYLVLAVDDLQQELCRSNRVGEHDFNVRAP
jgi:hypothetical protein